MKKALMVLGLSALCATTSFALPTLQLDILGGSYDSGDETTVTSDPTFTLRALLDPTKTMQTSFILGVAVTPNPGESTPKPNLGSFTVKSSGGGFAQVNLNRTVNVTGDMTYGTPPLPLGNPSLGGHGVYPTYFLEIAFSFLNPANDKPTGKIDAYNTQDASEKPGYKLWFVDFEFDITNLMEGYNLHFDLFNSDRSLFAPFSHDAETRVPDGGSTLALLGLGLVGLGTLRRKLFVK